MSLAWLPLLLLTTQTAGGAEPEGGASSAPARAHVLATPRPESLVPSTAEARRKPPAEPRRFPLRPVAGGGYEYEDSRFKARVAADGRVTFDDKRLTTKLAWLPILPREHPPGMPTLEGALRDLVGRGRRGKRPPREDAGPGDSGPALSVHSPLSRRDANRENPYYPGTPLPLVLVTGTFDLTDAYMRLMGQDPYSYEKARFLAATFDARLRLAVREHARRLARAQQELPAHLAAIWSDASSLAFERRRIICLLWVELLETPEGHEAAAIIERFVRQTLPGGSPEAYDDAELAACNAPPTRTPRFAPYDAPSSEPQAP